MEERPETPKQQAHLDAAIQRLAAAKTYDFLFIEIRTLVANVVVGQLLPDCVIKGGTALKLRYGRRQTRFTLAFDAASRMERKSFIEAMCENLANVWCDFTGTLDIERPAKPKGVPPRICHAAIPNTPGLLRQGVVQCPL